MIGIYFVELSSQMEVPCFWFNQEYTYMKEKETLQKIAFFTIKQKMIKYINIYHEPL